MDDLPHAWNGDPQDEDEEDQQPERKPVCTFVKSQTLLVSGISKDLQEFPVSGDEKKTKDQFHLPPWWFGTVYGYILNRRSEFRPAIYGWGAHRNHVY